MTKTPLSDLELTKLCARAMGYWHGEWSKKSRPTGFPSGIAIRINKNSGMRNYDPLYDDAQAMALVKKFELSFILNDHSEDRLWCVSDQTTDDAKISTCSVGLNENLNRA